MTSVDTGILDANLGCGFTPIVAPLGVDESGQIYNVNADTIAAEIARAMTADELVFVTEIGGVFRDPDDPGSLLTSLDASAADEGVTDGWITAGMRVKLETAFGAAASGIRVSVTGPTGLATPAPIPGTRILPSTGSVTGVATP